MTHSTYCGRLDAHDPHEWLGRNTYPTVPHVVRACPGAPVVEGGSDVNCCDECGLGVTDDELAPSCGAHRLHPACARWFSCRQCDHYRTEVCS